MPQASKVTLNELDLTFASSNVTLGVSGLVGRFKRGPINDPSVIMQSWPAFLKVFGGFVSGKDDAVVAQRAFDRGTTLRVVNLGHYTDVTNAATLDAIKATNATSRLLTGAGPLVAANTITVTLTGAVTVPQIFTTDSDTTWNLLAKAIMVAFPNLVSRAVYMGNNKLILTPATGIALTATAVVTGGAGQIVVTSTAVNLFQSSTPTTLFTLAIKYPGADYNNIIFTIGNSSNGDANSFNLTIEHLLEPSLIEFYPNIKIIGNPTAATATFLADVIAGSNLVNVTYLDLSGTAGQQRPVNTSIKLDSGTDGSAITDTDTIGSPVTKVGFYAFDGIGDIFEIGCVSSSVNSLAGGISYAEARKDLVFYGHLNNNLLTAAQIAAAKDAMLVDSTYGALWAGGVSISDPLTGLPRALTGIGDVLGASGYCNAKFGPWMSFAGTNRGRLFNALGVVNNFALDSQYNDRNLLANHDINILGNVDGKLQLMGNFTTQLGSSEESYLSIRKMLIYLKKVLGPELKTFIEEPNDIKTWKNIYQTVKPIFLDLKARRAIFDFDWQGDQFASSITKLQINNNADVDAGKYLVKCFVKPINSMQIIEVDITLTDSGVSFEDNLSTLTQTAA